MYHIVIGHLCIRWRPRRGRPSERLWRGAGDDAGQHVAWCGPGRGQSVAHWCGSSVEGVWLGRRTGRAVWGRVEQLRRRGRRHSLVRPPVHPSHMRPRHICVDPSCFCCAARSKRSDPVTPSHMETIEGGRSQSCLNAELQQRSAGALFLTAVCCVAWLCLAQVRPAKSFQQPAWPRKWCGMTFDDHVHFCTPSASTPCDQDYIT